MQLFRGGRGVKRRPSPDVSSVHETGDDDDGWQSVVEGDTTSNLCADAWTDHHDTTPRLGFQSRAAPRVGSAAAHRAMFGSAADPTADDVTNAAKFIALRDYIFETIDVGVEKPAKVLFGPTAAASNERSAAAAERFDAAIERSEAADARADARVAASNLEKGVDFLIADSYRAELDAIDRSEHLEELILGLKTTPASAPGMTPADKKKLVKSMDVDEARRELESALEQLEALNNIVHKESNRKESQMRYLIHILTKWIARTNLNGIDGGELFRILEDIDSVENDEFRSRCRGWPTPGLDCENQLRAFIVLIDAHIKENFNNGWAGSGVRLLDDKERHAFLELLAILIGECNVERHAFSAEAKWPMMDVTTIPFVRQLQGSTNLPTMRFRKDERKIPTCIETTLMRAIVRMNLPLWHPPMHISLHPALNDAIQTSLRMLGQAR